MTLSCTQQEEAELQLVVEEIASKAPKCTVHTFAVDLRTESGCQKLLDAHFGAFDELDVLYVPSLTAALLWRR